MQRHKRKGHTKEAKIGVMHLQANGPWTASSYQKLGTKHRTVSPSRPPRRD